MQVSSTNSFLSPKGAYLLMLYVRLSSVHPSAPPSVHPPGTIRTLVWATATKPRASTATPEAPTPWVSAAWGGGTAGRRFSPGRKHCDGRDEGGRGLGAPHLPKGAEASLGHVSAGP